jgi:DNA-binding SARP family transcriptional activator
VERIWRIELLGGLRIVGETAGDPADARVYSRFETRKTGALLAYLAFYNRRLHAREHLIDMLWPENALEAGRNKLRLALAALRRQLEPPEAPAGRVLLADRSFVQLSPLAVTTDVAWFEQELEAAAVAADAAEAQRRLMGAIQRYQGELLPGQDERWILPERQRLMDAYHGALRRLAAIAEAEGNPDGALQWARRAVTVDPLCEAAHRDVMRLLVALGRSCAALQQYRELERLLAAELNAEPDTETRALALYLDQRTVKPPQVG